MSRSATPVIMYHSVRHRPSSSWVYRHLTLEVPYFIQHLEYLRRNHWAVVSLDEVIAHKRGEHRLPDRAVCLTFDDGYLDNWVFAYPLLARYGFKATVFVATDFVDPRSIVRPTLFDVWNGLRSVGDLQSDGFMSWDELRDLQSSGVVSVESHTVSHTFLPSSDSVVDFHHPGDSYPWLSWNACPERKPFYMDAESADYAPYGTPVYPVAPALAGPDAEVPVELAALLIETVEKCGGTEFFASPNWRARLFGVCAAYSAGRHSVIRESVEEFHLRARRELADSKATIERELGKRVDYLCWPNGGWTDELHEMAVATGYVATTAKGSPNLFRSDDPTRILRTGLHQVGSHKRISAVYVHYSLNAHAGRWPYAQLRRSFQRSRLAPAVKQLVYR